MCTLLKLLASFPSFKIWFMKFWTIRKPAINASIKSKKHEEWILSRNKQIPPWGRKIISKSALLGYIFIYTLEVTWFMFCSKMNSPRMQIAFVAAENPPPLVCQLILLSNVVGSICPLESHLLEEEVLVATSVGKVASDCGDPTPPDLDRDPWQGTEADGFQVRNLRISRGGRRFFGVLCCTKKTRRKVSSSQTWKVRFNFKKNGVNTHLPVAGNQLKNAPRVCFDDRMYAVVQIAGWFL